ncbi:MAG: hypothetical protein HYZ14_15390 [Bacteroidetes bacterium]|nr:hypothetical protein [Bacteroidota bacterium]
MQLNMYANLFRLSKYIKIMGRIVKQIMLEKKASPTELAETVRKTQASIHRICRKESNPRVVLSLDIKDLPISTPVLKKKLRV